MRKEVVIFEKFAEETKLVYSISISYMKRNERERGGGGLHYQKIHKNSLLALFQKLNNKTGGIKEREFIFYTQGCM